MRIAEISRFQKKTPKDQLIRFLKLNCRPWLSQTNNGKLIAYRGVGTPRNHNDWYIVEVPQNRNPRDSTSEHHNKLISRIQKAGGIANRNNSIFVTGRPEQALAFAVSKEFHRGKIFAVVPVGNFNITWSENFRDWIYDLAATEINQIKTSNLQAAIQSGHEIMINSSYAVLIDIDFYKRHVLKELNVP